MLARYCNVLALLFVAACAASSPLEERGEVFCQSYEDSFLGQCRAHCDAEAGDQSEASAKECQAKCNEDLKDDDTFSSDCAARAAEL